MPTKTTFCKFVPIRSDDLRKEIREKGYCLTDIAVYLQPQYEFREDAYHHFKYWLKVGRMPSKKYTEMRELLDADTC